MARVVDSMPEKLVRSQTYPWQEWLDGQTWELKRGVDFDAEIDMSQMQHKVANNAHRRGLLVKQRSTPDGFLYLCARPKPAAVDQVNGHAASAAARE